MDGIPSSTLRRFHIHISFEDFNLARRLHMWTHLHSGRKILSEVELRKLAYDHKANPARIQQVLDICETSVSRGIDRSILMPMADDLLSRGEELMYGRPRGVKKVKTIYDPRFVNIGLPVGNLISKIREWQMHCGETGRGLNLLFYGKPGTGKTAFAKHLVDELGLQPVIKRGSDILSPFIGRDEKNIRDAFNEAESCALIIDEADTFLSDRRRTTHGWERSLTHLRQFGGLGSRNSLYHHTRNWNFQYS